MKTMNKVLSLLLCAIMVFGFLPSMTHAAESTNVTIAYTATEVNIGDTFDVKIGINEMTASSVAFGFDFDNTLLEVTGMTGSPSISYNYEDDFEGTMTATLAATSVSTKDEANESGHVGVAFANANEVTYNAKAQVLMVRFKALKAGTVELEMFEDSAGTDGYKGEWTDTTANVTIVDPDAFAETTVVFPCGDDGEATHADGSAANTYTQTVGDYTLTLTGEKMYSGGRDAAGNGCVKLGTASKAGSFSFTVPDDVTSVIIDVAAYKANSATVTINGTEYVLTEKSNNGEYDQITIDTSTNKTVTLTVTSGYRAMVNTVTYVIGTPVEHTCSTETLTKVDAKDATCTETGLLAHYKCECSKLYSDANATNETTLADVTVAKAEHDYSGSDDRICVNCGIYKDGSTLTVDEVLAYGATLAAGATTEYKYYVSGVITSVSNATYGNCYITDNDETSLLIYGIYKAGVRYDAMETKPIAGDTIKVYGAIQYYNGTTVEIMNAELIEHTAPDCYHSSVTFCEGTGATCSELATIDHYYCADCERNYADEACTELLTSITTGELGEHDYSVVVRDDCTKCSVCGYYKPDSTLTIEEAIAFLDACNNTGDDKYYISGAITEIQNTKYGNMIVKDATGELLIWGLYSADGSVRYDAMETKPVVGDTITVYGALKLYNTTYELINGWMTAHTVHTCVDGDDEDELCDYCGTDLHSCSVSTYTDLKDGTHQAYCECGKTVGEPVDHVCGGEKHTCSVCGAELPIYVIVKNYPAQNTNWSDRVELTDPDGDGIYTATIKLIADHNNEFMDISLYHEDGTYCNHYHDGRTTSCAIAWQCVSISVTYDIAKDNYTDNFNVTEITGDHTYASMGYDEDVHWKVCQYGCQYDMEYHNYESGTKPHTCKCGKVEEFTLTIRDVDNKDHTYTVPYGTKVLDYIKKIDDDFAATQSVNSDLMIGTHKWTGEYTNMDNFLPITADTIVEKNFEAVMNSTFTGWKRTSANDVWGYWNGNVPVTGWYEIEGEWYYLFRSETNGGNYRAEGLTRVPYPTVAINGITYAPNAEDIAYAESKGETFMDKTSALFYFDENGKFVYNANGAISHGDSQGKLVSGVLVWHPGFVEVAPGEYRYFVGDPVNGGNKIAEGLIYVTRNCEAVGYQKGDQLYFVNGKVDTSKNGIVTLGGVMYYFENGKLACGKGLVQVEDGDYIYVRSNGALAVGEYYLPTGLELASGLYQIDENGIIVNPVLSSLNGIHNGYYYVNGKITYAGLIKIGEDVYYIKSNGQVATGWYYVTKTNDIDLGTTKLYFGEDGKMEAVKNGIVEEGGKLYYYENNHIQYGAGVVKMVDDNNVTFYIYVRSNGQLATGIYWPTNTNDLLPSGKYDWGTDGKYYPAN